MATFELPPVYSHPDGWGPPPEGDSFECLGPTAFHFAYEHLDKYPLARAARICDFTTSGMRFQEQRAAKGKGKMGKGKMQITTPGKDEEGFALVDSRPLPNKTFGRGRSFGFKGKGGKRGIQVNYQEGILGQNKKPTIQNQVKGKGKGFNRGGQQRRQAPSCKEWSVTTKTEWPMKREIPLWELGKLQVDAKDVKTTDLMWCGELSCYDKGFDRLTVRTEQNVRRFEDLNFFNVTTSEDPILTDYMQSDPEVTVIATDHVLACLIAAPRSVYSWDLVITKLSNKIIIDKRDFSPVDFLSVNETAMEPPNADDKEAGNNSVGKLSQEAGAINQNFSQMVLDYNIDPEEMENPNPFEEEGEGRASSGAYRYRKFVIPGNPKDSNEFNQQPCAIIVRTEVNCKMPGGDPDRPQLCTLKALNEYDPKVNYSWRKHIETQRGMILATEIKNNAFKLGRWTAQAILAGCDTMKIGYVSRIGNDPWSHSVVSVQTHMTSSFAEQIGMHRNNVFGIIRAIVDMVMAWDDGKYLLIKDPLKSLMRIFEVPWDTFNEEEEGDDEDAEEEDEDIDEDGNIAPSQPVGPMAQ